MSNSLKEEPRLINLNYHAAAAKLLSHVQLYATP